MARHLIARTRKTFENALLQRDRLELRAMDAVLSAVKPPRPRGKVRECAGFRSVLCPVDFSLHSQRALRCAASVASRAKGTLVVAYINDPLLITAAALKLHDRHADRRSHQELDAFVAATLSPQRRRRMRVTTDVLKGAPVEQIIALQRRHNSDLIVVGTHGLTGTDRAILGSTTLGLLQRAPVPVLAVPRMKRATRWSARWPGTRIVAALELDRPAARDALTAARIARWFGASLVLVHVVNGVKVPPWLGGDLTPRHLVRIGDMQRKLHVLAMRAARVVPTETRILYGRPADELAALVPAEHTELLITGVRDRRGWFGARRGSVSYHVLTHATTPVLAYPPRWRFR